MNLYQSYKRNQYKKFDTGGNMKNKNFGAVVGFGAEIGAGIIDATAVADPTTGRTATGATVGKAALSGAAAGAMLGPVGAGVGAVLGAGVGLLTANKEKREARTMLQKKVMDQNMADTSRSNALIASDPSLLEGYKNSGYFGYGGNLNGGGGTTPAPVPGKAWTPPPAGTVYKTQEEVNAANEMAKRFAKGHGHVNAEDVYVARKPGDPITRFYDEKGMDITGRPEPNNKPLRRTLPNNVTIKDIKTGGGAYWYEDPQTGDVVDVDPQFIYGQYGKKATQVEQNQVLSERNGSSVAVKANGGPIKAPLATAFMTGGKAVPMSSDSVDLQGKSHEEGGISIPSMGAEVEDGETAKGDYVFSDRLGFAKVHKKLATMKGKIEKKPATQERVNSIKLISEKENMLMKMQEDLRSRAQMS